MASRVRFLSNNKFMLDNGTEGYFGSGTYAEATRIVDTKDGFIDVYLANGRILFGIDSSVIENHGVKVEVEEEKQDGREEVSEINESEPSQEDQGLREGGEERPQESQPTTTKKG